MQIIQIILNLLRPLIVGTTEGLRNATADIKKATNETLEGVGALIIRAPAELVNDTVKGVGSTIKDVIHPQDNKNDLETIVVAGFNSGSSSPNFSNDLPQLPSSGPSL